MADLKNETLVDRVVRRLQKQPLADLITEEDLHEVVKTAIPKAFFANREVPSSRYGSQTETKPPIIVEIVTELLRAEAAKAAEAWIRENPALVQEQWTKVFASSLEKFVMDAHSSAIRLHVFNALTNAFRLENEQRQRAGLPQIVVGL